MFAVGALCGLGATLFFTAFRCVFRVEEGSVAALTSFGAALHEPAGAGGKLRVWGPGLHTKLPWHHVHRVTTMEQALDLGRAGGQRAMAADAMMLKVEAILRYAPDRERLEQVLFGLRDPHGHVTGLFTCLLRNEIANVGVDGDAAVEGSYALIRRERGRVSARIREVSDTQIGPRYGLRFHAIDLTDVLPPDDLADALNAVTHARAEAEATLANAQADCERRALAAERGVEVARQKALAAEREVEVLARTLSELSGSRTLDLYVARRRAEVLAQSRAIYLRSDA